MPVPFFLRSKPPARLARDLAVLAGVGFMAAAALWGLRPSQPEIALGVAEVEAVQSAQTNGQSIELWLVTLRATNLTSRVIFFSREQTSVQAQAGGTWSQLDRAATLFHVPVTGGGLVIAVPAGTHACRFQCERVLDLGDRIDRWLRNRQRPLAGWLADRLPRKRFTIQVVLPPAPTATAPRLKPGGD